MSDDWREGYGRRPECKQCDKQGECESQGAPPEDGCPSAQPMSPQQQYEMQERKLQERASFIDHEILVLSGKGGVGKSTVAASLAWALALRDRRTGLLDADLHGPTIPLMMGLQGQTPDGLGGLNPIPVIESLKVMSIGFLLETPDTPIIWRGPARSGVIRQFVADVEWGALDYLVVDLPPGTGDEALTVAQAFPTAAGAVVVTTPQEASLSDCRKAINFLRTVKTPVLGVIENMGGFVCPHCGKETAIFGNGGGERMAQEMEVPFLGRIPLVPEIVVMGDSGRPLLGPDAPEAVRIAFQRIADGIEGALE